MVNGVVYTTAGTRRAVVALDAATGELPWATLSRGRARSGRHHASCRAEALRTGPMDGDERISTSRPAIGSWRSMRRPARASHRSATTASSI